MRTTSGATEMIKFRCHDRFDSIDSVPGGARSPKLLHKLRAHWAFPKVICLALLLAGQTVLAQTPSSSDPSPADKDTVLVAGDTAPLRNRTPVILIHGAGANDSINLPDASYFLNLINAFGRSQAASRIKVFRFHYVSDRYSARELARALRNAVDAETAKDPDLDRPLVIVAHSLGGLISRSYMNEHTHLVGRYSGHRGGERVIKLVTLATPHHGSPASSDQSWREISTNPAWTGFLGQVAQLFWKGVAWNQPSRSDLLWDNFDGRFTNSTVEINQWLRDLNQKEQFGSKIAVYSGFLEASDPNRSALVTSAGVSDNSPGRLLDSLYSAPHTQLRSLSIAMDYGLRHYYSENDGLVPRVSGSLAGLQVSALVECRGYDHLDMKDGANISCSSGRSLLDSVVSDVEAVAGSGDTGSPVITSLNPAAAPAQGPAIDLTVNGSGFVSGSVARWTQSGQSTSLVTQFVSATLLMARVPVTLLAAAGTAQVTVSNATGGISSAVVFTITANSTGGTPVITSLTPSSVVAGVGDFRTYGEWNGIQFAFRRWV